MFPSNACVCASTHDISKMLKVCAVCFDTPAKLREGSRCSMTVVRQQSVQDAIYQDACTGAKTDPRSLPCHMRLKDDPSSCILRSLQDN
jgi:hypothetical protein